MLLALSICKLERRSARKWESMEAFERKWKECGPVGYNAKVIPVISGRLGAVTKNLGDYLTSTPGRPDRYMCQKICLLGSKKILMRR